MRRQEYQPLPPHLQPLSSLQLSLHVRPLLLMRWFVMQSILVGKLTRDPAQRPCLDPDCIILSASILTSLDATQDPCENFYEFASQSAVCKSVNASFSDDCLCRWRLAEGKPVTCGQRVLWRFRRSVRPKSGKKHFRWCS
jgi:hypothetical protein